jgi:3-methylcrotonyl-CoA carboxylase alpha subunit
VEHPVTEMITGLDLVEWQLRVASGQPLPLNQEGVFAQIAAQPNAGGCAIEARIYAENPSKDFLPTTGKVVHMRPVGNNEDGVRADFGIRSGDTISTFYDPMIAKLIAHDGTRAGAVRKLERALRDFQVSGLTNNIDFLVHCVRNEGFAQKQATTAFFDEQLTKIMEKLAGSSASSAVVSPHSVFALVAHIFAARTAPTAAPQKTKFRPWNTATCGDWRSFGTVNSAVTVIGVDANPAQITVASAGDNFTFSLGDNTASAIVKDIRKVDTKSTTWTTDESVWEISLEVDGHRRSATVCSYRSGAAGNTVIDGECASYLICLVDMRI